MLWGLYCENLEYKEDLTMSNSFFVFSKVPHYCSYSLLGSLFCVCPKLCPPTFLVRERTQTRTSLMILIFLRMQASTHVSLQLWA